MNTNPQAIPNKLPSIRRLKDRAKAMKKTSDLSYVQCLNALAQQHGFDSWQALMVANPPKEGAA